MIAQAIIENANRLAGLTFQDKLTPLAPELEKAFLILSELNDKVDSQTADSGKYNPAFFPR